MAASERFHKSLGRIRQAAHQPQKAAHAHRSSSCSFLLFALLLMLNLSNSAAQSFLEIEQQPARNGSVGSPLSRQPVIVVKTGRDGVVATADLVGNIYVTASLRPTTPVGVLVGTERVLAECGIATFTDLRVDTMGEHAFNFRALVGVSSVTAASTSFFLTHGSAHHLSMNIQPSGSQAQLPLNQEPVILLLDSLNNIVVTGPDSVMPVTATVLSGTPLRSEQPAPELFPSNVSSYPSVEGVCKLSPISISAESPDVILHFSAPGVVSVNSDPFPTAGPPRSLNFSREIEPFAGALEPFQPQPQVKLFASGGILSTYVPLEAVSYVLVVSLILPAGGPGAGALLLGTKSVPLIDGTATYTDLRVDVEGEGYRLRFTLVNSAGERSVIPELFSANLTVQVGSPHSLRMLQPASGPAPTWPMAQQPVVAVVDLAGNVVPTDAVVVTATLLVSGEPDARPDNLEGTSVVSSVSGVVSFQTLSVRTVGTNYSISFTATPPLVPAISLPEFELVHGALDHIFISVQPFGASGVGQLATQPRVSLRDRGDNVVTSDSSSAVTASLRLPQRLAPLAHQYNLSLPSTDGVGWVAAEARQIIAREGVVQYQGLRVFGPATGGVTMAFVACQGLGGVGGCVDEVTSDEFAVAGKSHHLNVIRGATEAAWGQVGSAEWFDDVVVETVDSSGLPVTFEGVGVDEGGVGSVSIEVNLCFNTDRENAIFYCAGEEGREGGREPWREGELMLGELGWDFCLERGGENLRGALEGVTTALASGGVATFPGGLRLNQTGLFKLRFRAHGLAFGDSEPFEIVVGTMFRLEVLQQPAGMIPGQRARIHPVVGVVDRGNNVVQDGCSAAAGMEVRLVTNATVQTASTETLVASLSEVPFCVAEWTGLRIDTAGEGLRLRFDGTGSTLAGVLSAFSHAFAIVVGELAQIAEKMPPVGCVAGRLCEQFAEVLLLDAGGNRIHESRDVVATLVNATTGRALPNEESPVTFSNASERGLVVFDQVKVNSPLRAVILRYSSPPSAVTAASSAFDVSTDGVALRILTQPLDGSPGNQIRVQPRAAIVDASGVLVNAREGLPGLNVSVTAEDASGERVSLVGTNIATLGMDGIAVFTDLQVDASGQCTRLRFGLLSSDGTAVAGWSELSGPFNVLIGFAAQLTVARQPAMATAGAAFGVQPQVAVLDAGGNTVTSDSGAGVTAQLVNGRSDLLLGGAGKIKDSLEGVAAYTNLRLDIAGACWVISFVRPGIQSAFTLPLPVLPASPVSIHITQQPSGPSPATPLTTQPAIELRDEFGNVALAGSETVSVELLSASEGTLGSERGVLSGAVATVLEEGDGKLAAATFTDLAVDRAGNGFWLRFVSGSLSVAESSPQFSVLPGEAERLVFLIQPEGFRNNYVFTVQPVLGFQDGGLNLVRPNTDGSTVTCTFDALTMVLSGTTMSEYADGLDSFDPGAAGFTDLVIITGTASTERQVRLSFAAPNVRGVVFGRFDVGGVPITLEVPTPPSSGTAGDVLPVQPVLEVVDFSGVGVWWWEGQTRPNATVTVRTTGGQRGRQPQLLGTTAVEYEFGRAVFTDLQLQIASDSSGFTLDFSSMGLTATVTGVVVVPQSPARLVLVRHPLGSEAALPIPGDIRLDLLDEFGNLAESVQGWTVSAHGDYTHFEASSVAPGQRGLVGQSRVQVVNGIAEFNDTGLGCVVAGRRMRLYFNVTSGSGDAWTTVQGARSSVFNVSQGQVSVLRVETSPLVFTELRELEPQPVVVCEDNGGNAVTAANITLSASLLTSTVVLGTASAVDGIVTFTSLVAPSTYEGVRMVYACVGCGRDLSVQGSLVDISSQGGTASVVLLSSPPVQAFGGSPFDNQPVLETVDAGGRRVTSDSSTIVTATLLTNEFPSTLWLRQPGLLRGTTVAQAQLGLVTFTDLAISKCNDPAGSASCSGQTMYMRFYSPFFQPTCARTLSEPPCIGADSPAMTVSPGPPVSVAVSSQPVGSTAGAALSSQPRVGVVDAGGNLVQLPSPVTVSASLVALAGSLPDRTSYFNGRTTVLVQGKASNLDAEFSDLAVLVASTVVAIRFEAAALSPADSSSLFLSPGLPAHLAVTVQPLLGTAAFPVQPQPVVEIHDVGGNLVSSTLPGLSVTAQLRSGAAVAGNQIAVVNGVAAFFEFAVLGASDCLEIDFQTCETIEQCPTPLPVVTVNSLSVTRGLAAQLEILQEPQGAMPGSMLAGQPEIGVMDRGSNVVVTAQETLGVSTQCLGTCQYVAPHVDTALSPIPSPATATTPPRNLGSSLFASNLGLAPLSDVRIDRAGGPFLLHFFRVAGGFTSTTSVAFHVPLGEPYQLLLTQQPQALAPGLRFTSQPEVVIVDRGGNVMTDQQRLITVQLMQHALPADHYQCLPINQSRCEPFESLVGPWISRQSFEGAIAFPDLRILQKGSGYTLRFCDGSCDDAIDATFGARLLPVVSSPAFDLQAGEAYQVGLLLPIAGCITNRACHQQPVAELQDRGGNAMLDDSTSNMLLTVQSVLFNRSLLIKADPVDELTPIVKLGRAVFKTVYFTAPSQAITVAFHSTVIASAYQSNLVVTDPPATLSWAVSPPANSTIGVPMTPQPVIELRDGRGELVVADSLTLVSADLRHSDGRQGVLLGQWSDVRCCKGRCRFTDLALGEVGAGLRLSLSTPGGELWGAGVTPQTVMSEALESGGCYAPISCSGRGECRSDDGCACDRARFGGQCEVGLAPRVAVESRIVIADGAEISAGGLEGLVVRAGSDPGAGAGAGGAGGPEVTISMDLFDALQLPQKWLPRESDSFSPAGTVVDLRPEGVNFTQGMELTLAYTLVPGDGFRLWVYTFNWTSELWVRYEDGPVTVDTALSVVRVEIFHFSLWAVMIEPDDTPPPPPSTPSGVGAEVLAGRGGDRRANLTAMYVVVSLLMVVVLGVVAWHQVKQHRSSTGKVLEAEKERALREEEVKEEMQAIAMDEAERERRKEEEKKKGSVVEQDVIVTSLVSEEEDEEANANGESLKTVEEQGAEVESERRKAAKRERQSKRAAEGKEESKEERKARRERQREEKRLAEAKKLATHTVVEQGWGGWKTRKEHEAMMTGTPRDQARLEDSHKEFDALDDVQPE